MITLTKAEAETVIRALSAAASDEMRYQAWDVLDFAIKRSIDGAIAGKFWTPEKARDEITLSPPDLSDQLRGDPEGQAEGQQVDAGCHSEDGQDETKQTKHE